MSKFSLVCSAYKSELYLQQFLENVNLFDNAKDLTLYLVLNDSSSFEKKIISKASGLKYSLEVIEIERESISKSTNRGFKLCQTEFVGYLDVDDLHPPNSYKIMLNTLDNCELTYGDAQVIQSNGLKFATDYLKPFSQSAAKTKPIFGPTHFFRRSLLETVGYWDEQLISAADYDWQIRASAIAKVKKTNAICTFYNFSSLSASRGLANLIENLVIALRYHNLCNVGPYIEYLEEALKYDIQYCYYNNTKNSVTKFLSAYEANFLKQNKKQLQESFGIKKLIKYLILNLANKINLNLKK
jgi:hypothetical protein